MRITVCAVGRMKAGPEATLVSDYLARFDRTGRAAGLGPAVVLEVDAKGAGRTAEGRLLRSAVPKGAAVVALDERGLDLDSSEFARRLMTAAERGVRDLAFLIGGADGLDPTLRATASYSLSFGKMVWPHMLVRVMLSEQLYRASAILTGSPYHRGG